MIVNCQNNAKVTANLASLVRTSYAAPDTQRIILIHGQPGTGKTTLAASLSKHWPETGLPTTKSASIVLDLNDLFWFSWDLAATIGFRERGINVPEFSVPAFISTPAMYEPLGFKQAPSLGQAVNTGLQCLAAQAAAHGTRWVVVDTISTMDRDCLLDAQCATDDGRAAYGELYKTHMSFHYQMRRMGLNVCYLSHSKWIAEPSRSNEEAHANRLKNSVLLPTGSADVVPAISGQGQSVYVNDASFMLALVTKEARPGELKRLLITKNVLIGGVKYAVKHRFELSLATEEPANLSTVLNKCGLT